LLILTEKSSSLSNLASSEKCQYKNEIHDITCDEPASRLNGFCIFHDKDYLYGNNYERHKEKVSKRFGEKLSEYSSNNMPLKFIGYCLPNISFKNNQFTEELYFDYATFYGAANFSGATFSKGAYFRGAKFSSPTYFNEATFSNEANFSGATFSKEATFNRANFAEKISFLHCRFDGPINFLAVDFKNLADFVYCSFNNRAIFSQVYFYGEAWFGATYFSDFADFSDTFFDKNVYFIKSHFNREANFSNCIFGEKALTNFSHSTFDRDANFSNAEFKYRVDFSSAHFINSSFSFTKFQEARFASTKFDKEPIFLGADFNKVKFLDSKFYSGVDFRMARFQEAYFSTIKDFHGKADFSGAKFNLAYFYNSIFHNSAEFYQCLFQEVQFSEVEFRDETSFKFASFEKEGKILFDVKDLSKVSFMNSNITGIRFGENVRWGTGENEFKIIDEIKLEELPIGVVQNAENEVESSTRLSGIATVYRNLRKNYEDSFRYEQADKFFVREMEIKRQYREKNVKNRQIIKKNGWLRRNLSLTGQYYWISEYGQNYKRPALLALAIISLPILYSLIQQSFSVGGLNSEKIGGTIQSSLRSIFSITEGRDIVGYFIGIATIPILGALLLAALRKKFRH
jgi:uncharacterized protein YjbI with pentapeptide repeats